MTYSFDLFGWYSSEEIQGRSTEIAPPKCADAPTPGELYPNFTGYEWIMLKYVTPQPIEAPAPEVGPETTEPTERYISKNQFLKKFSVQEFTGLLSAAKVNVNIEYWFIRFNSLPDPPGVNMLDIDTIQGLNGLEAAGLIGKGRAAEILAA